MSEPSAELVLAVYAALNESGALLPSERVLEIAQRALSAAETETDARTLQARGYELDQYRTAVEKSVAARAAEVATAEIEVAASREQLALLAGQLENRERELEVLAAALAQREASATAAEGKAASAKKSIAADRRALRSAKSTAAAGARDEAKMLIEEGRREAAKLIEGGREAAERAKASADSDIRSMTNAALSEARAVKASAKATTELARCEGRIAALRTVRSLLDQAEGRPYRIPRLWTQVVEHVRGALVSAEQLQISLGRENYKSN